jgi:hypothetical protein
VYNLMPCFKRDCLPRGDLAVSFATVRRHSLEHAVGIEQRGEAVIHLVLSENDPLRREADLMLRKAVAA